MGPTIVVGVGRLTREIRARVINISRGGCLVETHRQLEVGTVGTLRLHFGIEEYSDDVQVVRCQAVEGTAALYQVGMRFLWTTLPHARSIRHAVARHAAALEIPGTTRVM